MRIQWTSAAIRDLDNITHYIRKNDPNAALNVRIRIVAATRNLEEFPEIGRSTLRTGYRLLVVKELPYLLGYRIQPDFIEIGAVIDGRMNRSPDLI
jgi:plasmid stabilization system protein ParE